VGSETAGGCPSEKGNGSYPLEEFSSRSGIDPGNISLIFRKRMMRDAYAIDAALIKIAALVRSNEKQKRK
jgi:hypothetical protein